jgi:hypothetical protein
MDWRIDYSPLPVYVRIVVAGTSAVADNKAMWDDLLASECWAPGTSVLFESSVIRQMGTGSYHSMQEVARHFAERAGEIGESCLAVLRADRDEFNYVSQFQYAVRLRGSSVTIRNFTDERAAVEWLETVYHDKERSKMSSVARPS